MTTEEIIKLTIDSAIGGAIVTGMFVLMALFFAADKFFTDRRDRPPEE